MSSLSSLNSRKRSGKRASLTSLSPTDSSRPSLASTSSSSSLKSSKTLSFPKIKSKESGSITSLNNSTSVTRILSSITQILEDESGAGNVEYVVQSETVQQTSVGLATNGTYDSSLPPLSSQNSLKEMEELTDAANCLSISTDSRRKLLRQCLELKRLVDKEGGGIVAESLIQKSLFSKIGPNVSILFKCLQATPEVDSALVVTNLLLRLVTNTETNSSNVAYMAKKNLALVLLKNLQVYFGDYTFQMTQPLATATNTIQRLEDVITNTYTLLVKLSKYDLKVPIIARLHQSVDYTIELVQIWHQRKEYPLMLLACSALRAFAARNDNNVITIQKSKTLDVLQTTLKSPPPQIQFSKLDTLVDLLGIIGRSKTTCSEILSDFGMKFFLNLATSAPDTLQKASLRLIRILIEHEDGKTAFQIAEGPKILVDALNNALHAPDVGSSSWLLANSIPALLINVLRAAISQSDLPFLYNFTDRAFPLPSVTPDESKSLPSLDPAVEDFEDYEAALADYLLLSGETLLSSTKHSPEMSSEAPKDLGEIIAKRLRRLCPEWDGSDDVASKETPIGNIRVRHVQPMAPGKHVVCRNVPALEIEPQLKKSSHAYRKCIYEQTARMFQASNKGVLVYDVMDERVAKNFDDQDGTLLFDSRFESGNLQMAIRISEFEYDLIVQSDINSTRGRHNQWFYFSVKQMVPNASYKFNILNMSKPASQFSNGMQPVMYSTKEPGWRRVGDFVFYLKNHYRKSNEPVSKGNLIDDVNSSTFSTLTFTIVFKNPEDTCFIAYHFPYTYSELQRSLYQLFHNPRYQNNCRRSTLCQTLGGNDCILLTITDYSQESQDILPMSDRKYVLLTGRVHPGESNSSHIMNGIIQFLLGPSDIAATLRQSCIFKIVPMLNPDGVVNGSHRCSLAGVDLNRQWKRPVRMLTPTVFWTKMLWKFLFKIGKQVLLACDLHGHSRKKNLFAFGCENPYGEGYEKVFPTLLAGQSPIFDLNSTKFSVERSKETTARVVLWRECNLINSFTLESSYNGADFGEKKGLQFTIADLEKAGGDFCCAIYHLLKTNEFSSQVITRNTFGPDTTSTNVQGSATSVTKSAKTNTSAGKARKTKSSSASSSVIKKADSGSSKTRAPKKAILNKRESQTSIDFEGDSVDPGQDSSSDDDG